MAFPLTLATDGLSPSSTCRRHLKNTSVKAGGYADSLTGVFFSMYNLHRGGPC